MNQHPRAAIAVVALMGLLPLAGCDGQGADDPSSSTPSSTEPAPGPSDGGSPSPSPTSPSSPTPTSPSDDGPEDSVTTYLVMFAPPEGVSDPAARKEAVRRQVDRKAAQFEERGLEVSSRYSTVGGLAVRATAAQAEELRSDPDVLSVEKDRMVSIPEVPGPSAT
ncbi:protease inhibitor I9 family protein [Kytococcus schroeteri]|uniref:protease inhibitor I9 family protein n=1 Tax=Kytococcus schroeteri TaxID=138300 RepID=UPI001144606F|nr:protease inhibitor I9 family protein [Kytococcus schroeteri]